MTVAELIEKLQKIPQDHVVWAESDYGILNGIYASDVKYGNKTITLWETDDS